MRKHRIDPAVRAAVRDRQRHTLDERHHPQGGHKGTDADPGDEQPVQQADHQPGSDRCQHTEGRAEFRLHHDHDDRGQRDLGPDRKVNAAGEDDESDAHGNDPVRGHLQQHIGKVAGFQKLRREQAGAEEKDD